MRASRIGPFRALLILMTCMLSGVALADAETWSYELRLPEGDGPFPVVIFLPGCTGYGPMEVRAAADKHAALLNRHGYAVALLDLLVPRGLDSICTELFWFDRMRTEGPRDVAAAAADLAQNPQIEPDRIGFMGQSFGGSMALEIASVASRKRAGVEPPIVKTAVAYYPYCYGAYGGGGTVDFDVPVLIMTGALDDWTPVSLCTRFPQKDPAVTLQIETLPEAHHSFDLDDMPRYAIEGVGGDYHIVEGNPAAAERSRTLYLDWLAEHL